VAEEALFAGKYELVRKLGEGGMAEIFLARPRGAGAPRGELVIKRIHPELARNESYVELFLDEARVAADLEHPNIVRLLDIGKAEGTYYLAMEYVRGADLMEICRRGIQRQRFLPLAHAVTITREVARGLQVAHQFRDGDGRTLSIVHRDVSPSNILVGYDGQTKLADFGIAKAATQVHDDAGKIMGKWGYMAPEQLRTGEVDPRSDLFSLGVVLYEITVGRRLYRGAAREAKQKILEQPVPAPTRVRADYPRALERIVLRLLERDPAQRYPDAETLIRDLEAFASEAGLSLGRGALSRYLVDLFEVEGVPLGPLTREDDPARDPTSEAGGAGPRSDRDPDDDAEEGDELDFDRRPPPALGFDPGFDPDFAEELDAAEARAAGDAGARQAGASGDGAREPGVREAGARQAGASGDGAREPGARGDGAREPGAREDSASETVEPEIDLAEAVNALRRESGLSTDYREATDRAAPAARRSRDWLLWLGLALVLGAGTVLLLTYLGRL
jgi:serine/threonine protein kinase